MPKFPPKPDEFVVLTADMIDGGKLYRAGSETPFTEASLPPHLREYLADGSESFYTSADRNYYDGPPVPGAPDPLPPETQEALEDAHALHIAKVKAQMLFNQHSVDATIERAQAEAEAQTGRKLRSTFLRSCCPPSGQDGGHRDVVPESASAYIRHRS